MRDPVMAPDGVTYERAAIEAYFCQIPPLTEPLSPSTATVLPSEVLLPNRLVRDMISHLEFSPFL